MKSPNTFWLALHELAEAYDSEGLNPDERARNIADQYQEMPHIAQREVLADLLRIALHVPDLCSVILAAANQSDEAANAQTKPKLHSA